MLKLLLLTSCAVFFLHADNSTQRNNNDFLEQLQKKINSIKNSNLPNNIKLEKIQEYVANMEAPKDESNEEKSNLSLYDLEPFQFNLMSHHDNFLLIAGHSPTSLTEKHWNTQGQRDFSKDYTRKSNEAQFQISLKVPLLSNMFGTTADLYAAYTQNSYWQVYDKAHSRPFRETNYMPELFVQWQPNIDFGWTTLEKTQISLIHQSNGEDLGESRSWNRTEAMAQFRTNNLKYGFHIWDRWDEKQKTDPSQSDGDDNPDLTDFIGRHKLFVDYNYKGYGISLTHQNDLFEYDINKGNTILDILLPSPNDNFNFFIRHFYGYGESLIDYDVKLQRTSFGIKLSQWNK
jgi:phospholipase A1